MIKNSIKKLLLSIAIILSSCTDDDKVVAPVNELEYITTVTAVFKPQNGGTDVVLEFKDLDGEGANDPIITTSIPFQQNKTYLGSVSFKNELISPAGDITPEIIDEALEHQLFYQTTGNLNPFMYATNKSNYDRNGKPIGLQSVYKTSGPASGVLRLTLRHGPDKNGKDVPLGIITNAGGATDIAVDFPITVE
jgi:hypothetical protein